MEEQLQEEVQEVDSEVRCGAEELGEVDEGDNHHRVAPQIFTADSSIGLGSYHGECHIAMRMSSACRGALTDVKKTHPEIWASLPEGYDYHICVIEIPDPARPDHFKLGLRLPIRTEAEMNRWVEDYQRVSFTQWRIGHGNRRSKAVRILYQRSFKCQHNIFVRKRAPGNETVRGATQHSSAWRGPQHTGCQARLNVAIRVHVTEISKNRQSKVRDIHMPDYPAMVSISHTHNHATKSEYALRFRTVDRTVDDLYTALFKAGHSALTAHSFVQWKRWAEHGSEYEAKALDRAYNPDMAYVYRIFYRMMRERRPHTMKPRKKKKKPGDDSLSEPPTPLAMGAATTTTTTGAGTPGLGGLRSGVMVNGFGSEVILEGDEGGGDTSPQGRTRLGAPDDIAVHGNLMKQGTSMTFMDAASVIDSSGILGDTALLENSDLGSKSLMDREEIEVEEADRDFFAHGFKTRIAGTNRKRRNTVNLKELYEDLEQLVSKHVNETQPAHAHLARITGNRDDMIIAICTPLMRRAHTETTIGGDVCILDGTFQSFGQVMCYVVSFMVPCPAGGIPLGFLVLSSLDQVFITQGLELFKMLIPDDAFGGRGRDGPAHFLTDEDHFKADIVQATFPSSNVLISPYHLILMAWRWMVDPKRRIDLSDQMALLDIVKELTSCQTAEEIQTIHLKILGSDINDTYREFAPFVIENIVNRWAEWLLPVDHPIHRAGVGNEPWQKVMNCLRDRVLMRGRHFNILQMTHFLLHGVDETYRRNLEEGCKSAPQDLSFAPVFHDPSISRAGIKQLSPTEYLVNAKNKSLFGSLTVNTELGLCSCNAGKAGYLCVHLAAVHKYYNLPSNLKQPFLSPREQYQIYKVATGEKVIHEQLTDTMQQLAEVVEGNLSTLTDPIRHFIRQMERADSTQTLAAALEGFRVMTREEEEREEEEERKREEEERGRRRRKEEEERRRVEERVRQELEEKRKEEEERSRKAEEEKRRKEERRTEEEARRRRGKDRKKHDMSWLLSKNALFIMEKTSSNEKKSPRKLREESAGTGQRTPIMTPGRAVTRGVTRMLSASPESPAGKQKKKKKGKANQDSNHSPPKRTVLTSQSSEKEGSVRRHVAGKVSNSSPSKQTTLLTQSSGEGDRDGDALRQQSDGNSDSELVLLMSDEGGMLVKGTTMWTPQLGKVLVVNKPVKDQKVGMVVFKDKVKRKKGKS